MPDSKSHSAVVDLVRLTIWAVAVFVIAQAVRVTGFSASGRGWIPLGIPNVISAALTLLTPLIFYLGASRFGLVDKAGRLFLVIALATALGVGTFYFHSAFGGMLFFSRAFEAQMQRCLAQGALEAWAEAKLRSIDGIDREENVRLSSKEIPLALTQYRRWNEPGAVLVLLANQRRWAYLKVKWREAFAEWGLLFTDKNDHEFDSDPQLRKLRPGVYVFYN